MKVFRPMSMIGQRVVCIDASGPSQYPWMIKHLKEGTSYIVRDVYPSNYHSKFGPRGWNFRLRELKWGVSPLIGFEIGYNAKRFAIIEKKIVEKVKIEVVDYSFVRLPNRDRVYL